MVPVKCVHCPDPGPCHGDLCAVAATGDPVFLAHIRARNQLPAVLPVVALAVAGDDAGRSEVRGFDPAELDQLRRDRRRADLCPARSPHGGCGCDGWCARGRGYGVTDLVSGDRRYLVTLVDCRSCPDLPPDPAEDDECAGPVPSLAPNRS